MPTKIEGEPSYSTLTTLQKELKANASSMGSDIGDDDHGYLGLVLSDAKYVLIDGTTPFLVPCSPPALTIPAAARDVKALCYSEAPRAQLLLTILS